MRRCDCPVNRPIETTSGDTWQLCFLADHGVFYPSDAQVNTPAVANSWVHVARVFDGAHASSWLDGEIISLNLASKPTYDPTIGI